jgi:hypothetical protein
MRDLLPFLTVKNVIRKGARPIKAVPSYWDALPWEGGDKKLEDFAIHPYVSRMWKKLFDRDNQTPYRS